MLRQLDKLGEVGTRVINASTRQHRGLAAPPAADPHQARRRRRRAGPRPRRCWPASRSRRRPPTSCSGDYANALFHIDIDLDKLIKSPGRRAAQPDQPVQRPARSRRPAQALSPAAQGQHRVRRSTPPTSRRCCARRAARRRRRRRPTLPDLGTCPVPASSSRQLERAPAGGRRSRWAPRPRGRWLQMTRGVQSPPDRLPGAQRRRHRLRRRQLPRAHRPAARARAHHPGDACRPPAACSPAARSPTAASRSARSPRCT